MRYIFVAEVTFLDYKHVLHAHSHVALLGWGYMFISGSMLFYYLKSSVYLQPYQILFSLNIVSTIGMAAFFTYQGYGAISIAFSSLHLISVYLFAYYFLKDLESRKNTTSKKFIKWSIYWLLISTLGLWAIGPISATLGKLHPLYYSSIQFFLHFQFNGWFTYAVIGLWIHSLESDKNAIYLKNSSFWILQFSLLLTYALSITWSTPLSLIFYLNSLGVILQAIAYYLILKPVFEVNNPFKNISSWVDWVFIIGVSCLVVKILIQVAVAVPAIAEISYTIRNYVIGFIHLIMLGSITLLGASILLRKGLLPLNRISKYGWMILSAGFVFTEVILFSQGTLLWMKKGFIDHYYKIILGATLLLPAGIFLILFGFTERNYLSKSNN